MRPLCLTLFACVVLASGFSSQVQASTVPNLSPPSLSFSSASPHPSVAPSLSYSSTANYTTNYTTTAPSPSLRPKRRHGIGISTGLTVVPVWILSANFQTSTTALCRPNMGTFAEERGLLRNEGCNWWIGGEYIYRSSERLDIVGKMGYQQLRLPDGLWLNKQDWPSGCTENEGDGETCDFTAVDYAEIDLSYFYVGADFIGRVSVVDTKDFDLQIGGGGGLSLAIFTGGGIFQTPLGASARSPESSSSCRTLEDLKDFTRCTPRWWDDPEVDQDGDGQEDNDDPIDDDETNGPGRYAQCDAEGCDSSDLQAFGTRKNTFGLPALPIPNVFASVRIMIRDMIGINFNGGFNTGFYFGGSVQYFFGSKGAK